MATRKIAFYYQKLDKAVSTSDDLGGLIDLHTKTFEHYGWEVLQVDEQVSRKHPKYDVFNDPTTILGKSVNPWEYARACYMRWLAYAVVGCYFADFDVINYGFTPEDAEEIVSGNTEKLPIFLAGAGAMGLLEGDDYDKVINTYLQFIEAPRIEGPLVEDINDMTILRHYHPEWYNAIPYDDDRFVKDYSRRSWETAKLVHYPHGLTDIPRVETIRKVRPPLLQHS